jgi:hypothetical protein
MHNARVWPCVTEHAHSARAWPLLALTRKRQRQQKDDNVAVEIHVVVSGRVPQILGFANMTRRASGGYPHRSLVAIRGKWGRGGLLICCDKLQGRGLYGVDTCVVRGHVVCVLWGWGGALCDGLVYVGGWCVL